MPFDDYHLSKETEALIGLAIEVHKELGPGFLEIVYKEAFEYELRDNGILYQREKSFVIPYKGIVISKTFTCDFCIDNNIIIEIKSKSTFAAVDYAQTLNYLRCSGCKVALLLNFGGKSLTIKRLVL